jgi:hypothetical protein
MAAKGSINAIPYQPIIGESCTSLLGGGCSGGIGQSITRLNYFGYCLGLWDFSFFPNNLYQSVDTSSAISNFGQSVKRIQNLAAQQNCTGYGLPLFNNLRDKILGKFLRVNNSAVNGPMYTHRMYGSLAQNFGEFNSTGNSPLTTRLDSPVSGNYGAVHPEGGNPNWSWGENINTERTYMIIANYYEAQDGGTSEYHFLEQKDSSQTSEQNNDTSQIMNASSSDSITHKIPIASGSAQQELTSTFTDVWKMQGNIITIIQQEKALGTEFRINAGYGCPTQRTYHTISQIYNQATTNLNTSTFANGAFTIGGLINVATGGISQAWSKGAIYVMAVWGRALKTHEAACIESFLMDEYNIMPIYDQLVGWWDFTWVGSTDNPNLFQSRNGTTAVGDGDPIGYVKNLAPGDSSGNKLGQFLRADADDSDHRPIWRLGSGGYSHAEWGADSKCGLRGGYFTTADCDDDGGISATKFSDLVMTSQNMTVLMICKDDVVDSSGNYIFQMGGHNAINDTSASQFFLWKKASDQIEARWGSTGEGSVEDLDVSAIIDTDNHLWTTIGNSGTNGAKIEMDGTVQDTETLDANYTIDFSKESNNTVGRPRVSMGCLDLTDAGNTIGAWDGHIYECLVYAKTLSTAERECLERYVKSKYGIVSS